MKYGLLVVLFLAFWLKQVDSKDLGELLPEIESVISKAKDNIWQQIEPNEPLWNMPPWLGTFFLSEYYFQLKALNITQDMNFTSRFDQEFFTSKLIREQQFDGSWMQLVDLNRKQGSLDATIFNYWYLKDVGVPEGSETLKKARKFILDHGGLQNSQVMTRYKLAAFGQYEWHLLPYVPLFIFKTWFPFSFVGSYIKDYVAQWVYPHLTGLAYLRYHKTIFPVSRFCLSELRISRSDHCEQISKKHTGVSGFKNLTADADVDNLLQEIIQLKGKKGSFGAYTISTLLNLLSFKDYSLSYPDNDYTAYFKSQLNTSLTFVENMYFNERVPYEGSLDDGRYWDTLLCTLALLEAKESPQKLLPTVDYLIKTAVQENGGIPYGHQFEYAPDIDDTGVLLQIYGKLLHSKQSYSDEIKRTYSWLKSTQNQDGGFPAFDKDKNDNQYKLIKLIFTLTHIDKSAEIFDPSCPDIVGHVLEGMGECNIADKEVVKKAIEYLLASRKDGMWSARWGINYVYAVGAVLPGLARVGFDLNKKWVRDIINRLKAVQQGDGGFGEDSEGYNKNKYVEGATTASMTAWGLLAYLEVAHFMDVKDNIKAATNYLMSNFRQNGNRFFDRSVVGTGHRGVLNLQYPVYAYSFPLIALARLKTYLQGKNEIFVDEALNLQFPEEETTDKYEL